ncbi:DNA/RNA helicase, DEAD/DEAH box type [Ophiocordyceps camponoti-floridani]|uniref:DNA/RNA helicase, DEAD/DEAH box type n=1 Tax=Ophiocordyceps camponoti-floridani TaxID=2030778 RepID=A0A8H4VBU0_9HYPO|nr:DNA/RNA helicase, DEAD/DEAH box type [Ophiocordyceps camponoti-floridani]
MSNPKKRSAATAPDKQPKKKKSKTKSEQDDDGIDTVLGINTLFSRMDNQLLADYLAQLTARFGGDLSTVELNDLAIPASCIRDTTSWQKDRTLQHLPAFLEAFAETPGSLKKAPKAKGSPHTLIVAGAGMRAADIVRAVRSFASPETAVAKLFAKHFKVQEQVDFLKNKVTGIGVGTPARLAELMKNGALSVDGLQRLVVDASHIDQKKRGVMDMKDTALTLARFLARQEFRDRYGEDDKSLALLFY